MILPEKYSVLELLIYLNKFYLKKNSIERHDFIEIIDYHASVDDSSFSLFNYGDNLGLRFLNDDYIFYLNLTPESNWGELHKNFIHIRFYDFHHDGAPFSTDRLSFDDLDLITEIIEEEGFDEIKINLINRSLTNKMFQPFNRQIIQAIEFIQTQYGEI